MNEDADTVEVVLHVESNPGPEEGGGGYEKAEHGDRTFVTWVFVPCLEPDSFAVRGDGFWNNADT